MNYKSVFVIIVLLTFAITVSTLGKFDINFDDIVVNIDGRIRVTRSYGCNGPNDHEELVCRLHCRNNRYKTGACDELANYEKCVCRHSSRPKWIRLKV
ncbi:unnamed protein product [Rotaria magnacalcarata]|uniref:Uncharacterized protein n=1 Tax=Rotaria magnacalcarata TaxID=392030 RepID=A0A8S2Q5M1_9BILA|nr:unnamed protein product [Rotaria magnacalcarata]